MDPSVTIHPAIVPIFESGQIGPLSFIASAYCAGNSLNQWFAEQNRAISPKLAAAILARLALGEACVNELADPFDMSQPAISKHLKVLERAGLISRGRDAQRRPCRLEAEPLAAANEWLETYREFWEASFQRLDAVLEELKAEKKKKRKRSTR